MLLFFDTETTGLPKKITLNHPNQPHVVQLAALLCDGAGAEMASINLIVDCSVEIPQVVVDVHGITTEIAKRCGVLPPVALQTFASLARLCDKVVAHNIPFDTKLMDIMSARWAMGVDAIPRRVERVCTMKMANKYTQIPPTAKMVKCGHTNTKPPRLSEAYKFFFDKELVGAHDAMVDVRACKDIYFEMLGREGEGGYD